MSQNDTLPQVGAQTVEVGAEQAGQRLDNFLLARLRGSPRSLIYRIVRSGEVRVNSARCKPERRLCEGDKVRVPPLRLSERTELATPGRGLIATLQSRILFEDEALADVLKVNQFSVNLVAGVGVEMGLGVCEEFGDVDFMGFEGDLIAITEAEVEVRFLAGGLGLDVFKSAPVADDLVEAFLAPFQIARNRS